MNVWQVYRSPYASTFCLPVESVLVVLEEFVIINGDAALKDQKCLSRQFEQFVGVYPLDSWTLEKAQSLVHHRR